MDIIDNILGGNHTTQNSHLVRLEVEPHRIRHLWLILSFTLPRFPRTSKPCTAIHTPKKKPWVPPVAPTLAYLAEVMHTAVLMRLSPHHLVVDHPPSFIQSFRQLQFCPTVYNLRHNLARQAGLHCVCHSLLSVCLTDYYHEKVFQFYFSLPIYTLSFSVLIVTQKWVT